jgi:hypothetical protein
MMRLRFVLLASFLLLSACAAPSPTAVTSFPSATPRALPTFPPLQTRTPTRTPVILPTDTPVPTLGPIATSTPTPETVARGSAQPIVSAPPDGPIARADLPPILTRALIAAGVTDPKVYWFTFDEGDREQALMVQYASPLRWESGYLDMNKAARLAVAQYYLRIEPPLYSAFIAPADITGESDLVVRLRRDAVQKWADGQIGQADFINNYFQPTQIVISCTPTACTAKMATPFPTFNFPFPFPTPTP